MSNRHDLAQSETSPAHAPAGSPPERLGPYRLLEPLGAGSMGVVYEAADDERHGRVALKTLPSLDPAALHAFKQEFRRVAGLQHPNLVRLYELMHVDDTWLFTMELVDGVDLLEWVRRADGTPDPDRLRDALRQLALGVQALHEHGLVHLDLKPANVLVDPSGRVVVLDFGLVRPADADASAPRSTGGTPYYMAPEQLARGRLGPAADWYAVGLMLHEALTGETPFGAAPWQVLNQPAGTPPPRPSARQAGVPAELDALCAALLAVDPAQRAGAAEVLALTGTTDAGASGTAPSRPAAVDLPGREPLRRKLHDALEEARAGRPVLVHVSGTSGAGKTTLVQQFLDGLRESGGSTVLSGRCDEWESLPFKGFDPAIDELCARVAALPPPARERLAPPELEPAALLFPVLRTILPASAGPLRDEAPLEQRTRAFQALKALLRELGRTEPVVCFLDDVQWGDADGARLLVELLSPPDAPRLLAIVAYRPDEAEHSPFLRELRDARSAQGPLAAERTLEVGPLSTDDGVTLARALLGADADDERARALAREAAGTPFILAELVRLASAGAEAAGEAPTVDDVVRARVDQLPEAARRVLEVVAVAGRLPSQELALALAGVGTGAYRVLADLRSATLVRTRGPRASDAVEPYHDRIRESIVRRLAPSARTALHHSIALALEERRDVEPDVLVHHWKGAGELAKARAWAVQAADRAASALAFARAASHYRQALDWGAEDRTRLEERLANALFNAGRASEAASVFAAAAAGTSGAHARELRRRAAEAWLQGGRLEQGIEALRPLLAEAGMPFPSTSGAVVSLLGLLGRQALSAVGARERRGTAGADAVFGSDLCWGAGKVLTNIVPMMGLELHLRALRRASDAGDARREGRSLTLVGTVFHSMGGPLGAAGARMLARAERLASETADPYLRGILLVFRGVAEFSGEGRWAAARAFSEEGLALFAAHCPGTAWERDMALATALKAVEFEGDVGSFGLRASTWMREALDRGDLYAQLVAAWWGGLHRLASGDHEGARELMRRALAEWPQAGYTVQHFHALRLEVACDLHDGRAASALERYLSDLPRMRGIGLHRLTLTRIEMLSVEAMARASVAAQGGRDRDAQLARVLAIAAQLSRERRSDGPAFALLLQGAAAALTGERARAAEHLTRCEERALAANLDQMAWCARRRRAEVTGDASLLGEVDAWFLARGASAPERWVAVHAPPVRLATARD